MRIRLLVFAALFSSLIGFEIPHAVTIPDGAYGVFQFQSLNAPLYTTIGTDQATVDLDDCALIRKWGDGILIADHAGSEHGDEEWRVEDFQVGVTGFVITSTETRAYRCTAIYLGEYEPYGYTYDGTVIKPHTSDLICVSCGRKEEVYIAYLDYVGVLP